MNPLKVLGLLLPIRRATVETIHKPAVIAADGTPMTPASTEVHIRNASIWVWGSVNRLRRWLRDRGIEAPADIELSTMWDPDTHDEWIVATWWHARGN